MPWEELSIEEIRASFIKCVYEIFNCYLSKRDTWLIIIRKWRFVENFGVTVLRFSVFAVTKGLNSIPHFEKRTHALKTIQLIQIVIAALKNYGLLGPNFKKQRNDSIGTEQSNNKNPWFNRDSTSVRPTHRMYFFFVFL